MLTADTITDEQIRELQQSVAGYAFPTSGMAHTEMAEIYETCTLALHGGEWSPPSPRSDARARCAEILSARMSKEPDYTLKVDALLRHANDFTREDFIELARAALDQAGFSADTVRAVDEILPRGGI